MERYAAAAEKEGNSELAARDPNSLEGLYARGNGMNLVASKYAEQQNEFQRLKGVMDEETFALKSAEVNDPKSDLYGQRITSKVRDKDGNVSTRYIVPEHLQGRQRDPNSLTPKDRYRYQTDYHKSVNTIKDVFREQESIARLRESGNSRPSVTWEGMTEGEKLKQAQTDWEFNYKMNEALADRERRSRAALDNAINDAVNAGYALGRSPEETMAEISKVTGLDIGNGKDPFAMYGDPTLEEMEMEGVDSEVQAIINQYMGNDTLELEN